MGYDSAHQSYRVFDPEVSKIFVSNQVTFNEDVFPFQTDVTTGSDSKDVWSTGAIAGGIAPFAPVPSGSSMSDDNTARPQSPDSSADPTTQPSRDTS